MQHKALSCQYCANALNLNCLEVGVFTGYSSLCISSAIEDDSRLTVIDNNNEYLDIAEKYWKLANVVEKINVIKKDA